MRAVHVAISEAQLRERRQLDLDRLDEMWEGELHMVPPPSFDHQDVVGELYAFLRAEVKRRGPGKVIPGAGVHEPSDPEHSYRVPDLSYVAGGNAGVIQERGIVGPADAVIEVRSPGDETYEKFPFFAGLGIREVVVIDRDTRRPEAYRLAGKQYLAVAPAPDGWVTAEVLGVRLRRLPDRDVLRVEALDNPGRWTEI